MEYYPISPNHLKTRQKTPLGNFVNQGRENLHSEHKKLRGERVSLSGPPSAPIEAPLDSNLLEYNRKLLSYAIQSTHPYITKAYSIEDPY